MSEETEARRERMERAMIASIAKLMGDEDVGLFDAPDLDDFTEDYLTVCERTNVFSDAYRELQEQRAAKQAAE